MQYTIGFSMHLIIKLVTSLDIESYVDKKNLQLFKGTLCKNQPLTDIEKMAFD